MRNLKEYPITYKEKHDLIMRLLQQFNADGEIACGDMTGVILNEIAEDLWRLEDLND